MRHFLIFEKPNLGRIEIAEPRNFRDFNLSVKQAPNRYGRDFVIGGEEISLTFGVGYYEQTDDERVNDYGKILRHLTNGYDLLQRALDEAGSEAVVFYEVQDESDEVLTIGQIDFPKLSTNDYNTIECNVIQDTNKAILERRKDLKANVFSITDTFGNPQTPLQKYKYLLKNVPVVQTSVWDKVDIRFANQITNQYPLFRQNLPGDEFPYRYVDFLNASSVFQLENSLSVFDMTGGEDQRVNGDLIKFTAINNYENVEFKLSNLNLIHTHVWNGATAGTKATSARFLLWIYDENKVFLDQIELFTSVLEGEERQEFTFPNEITYNLDLIPAGYSFALVLGTTFFPPTQSLDPFNLGAINNYSNIKWTSGKLTVKANRLGVNTVIDAVKYEQFLKKGIKSISGLDADVSLFNSKFKNQFVFNRQMIQRNPDAVLNFDFDDEANDFTEVNLDYRFLENDVVVSEFPDFYTENEIGVFLELPDSNYQRSFNPRFQNQILDYKYKVYAKDKDSLNTTSAFHTELQANFPNRAADDALKIEINKVRDPYRILEIQVEAAKTTTLLELDDEICIYDSVPLAPNFINTVVQVFDYLLDTNTNFLQLKTNESFTWASLGIEIGQTVNITGVNAGSYTVRELLGFVIRLQKQVGNPSSASGREVITFSYALNGVLWTNRTNENINFISGLVDNTKTGNIAYSIKNNLLRTSWSNYLATVCRDVLDGTIVVNNFKANGEVKSQITASDPILKENANIPCDELPEPILDKFMYKVKVPCDLFKAKQIFELMESENGFVRVLSNSGKIIKGYPQQLTANLFNGIMEFVLEGKAEPKFLEVVKTGDIIDFSGLGYPLTVDRNFGWYKIYNDMVTLYDADGIPLINPTNYRRIKINGVIYDNLTDFQINLQA